VLAAGARAAAAAAAPREAYQPAVPVTVRLLSSTHLDPAAFDGLWGQLATVDVWGATLKALPAPGELAALLAPYHFALMASGTASGVDKNYFYAQQEKSSAVGPDPHVDGGLKPQPALCIVEASVARDSLRLSIDVKASSPAVGVECVRLLKAALRLLTATN
jgi:hypothetical protein